MTVTPVPRIAVGIHFTFNDQCSYFATVVGINRNKLRRDVVNCGVFGGRGIGRTWGMGIQTGGICKGGTRAQPERLLLPNPGITTSEWTPQDGTSDIRSKKIKVTSSSFCP